MQNKQTFLTELLRHHYSDSELSLSMVSASGGDIHQSAVLHVQSVIHGPKVLFTKLNHTNYADVLATEYQALKHFQNSAVADHYPKPILFNSGSSQPNSPCCVLIMEHLDLVPVSYDSATRLGQCLSRQHGVRGTQFGWESDNFIGTTPQKNQWRECWPTFFAQQRLAPQLRLATERGLDNSIELLVKSVINNLPAYFDTVTDAIIEPSLLHGDLWVGNLAASGSSGKAWFYDPAPYFGDPEVDIAMSKLFGRLPESFYTAYHAVHPVRDGAERRARLYDLYHMLNHFNLFGASYESAISSILRDLS